MRKAEWVAVIREGVQGILDDGSWEPVVTSETLQALAESQFTRRDCARWHRDVMTRNVAAFLAAARQVTGDAKLYIKLWGMQDPLKPGEEPLLVEIC